MSAKDGWREMIRGAFVENVGLKVVSLIVAVALYAFIHGTENAQRIFQVSVVTLPPPSSANLQLMTQPPTEVSVKVRGSRTHLADLQPDALGSLQLDLRTGQQTRLELDPTMFHVPPGLTIEEIYPSTIELRWDEVVNRKLPVQVARTGDPAPGFMIKGAISVDPQQVEVRGPKTVVNVMQFVRTAPFDITGLVAGVYKRPLALDKLPPQVKYEDVESVVATAEIARELSPKEFGDLKVEVVGLPRATTQPPTVKIVVRGTAEDVNGLYREAIIPRVEPKSANLDLSQPGSAVLDVLVDLPPPKVTGQPLKVDIVPSRVLVKW